MTQRVEARDKPLLEMLHHESPDCEEQVPMLLFMQEGMPVDEEVGIVCPICLGDLTFKISIKPRVLHEHV